MEVSMCPVVHVLPHNEHNWRKHGALVPHLQDSLELFGPKKSKFGWMVTKKWRLHSRIGLGLYIKISQMLSYKWPKGLPRNFQNVLQTLVGYIRREIEEKRTHLLTYDFIVSVEFICHSSTD